jgi:hypothetical protein
MPADWRNNLGSVMTPFAGVQDPFVATTQTNVPQTGDYFIAVNAGWQGSTDQGARISGVTIPGIGALTELAYLLEPGDNHVLQVWFGGPLPSGGSHLAATFTIRANANAGLWRGAVFSIGGLTASPVDAVVGRDNQSPGSPVITASSGTLAQADELGLGFMYPVDAVGQTITPTWTDVFSATGSEPMGIQRTDLSATTAVTAQWALGSGGSGSKNPLSVILTLKAAGGGGGGDVYVNLPELSGGLSFLTGGLQND